MCGTPYLEGLLLKRERAVGWRFLIYIHLGRLGDSSGVSVFINIAQRGGQSAGADG